MNASPLILTTLISSFGRGSRPLRRAALLISGLAVAVLICGLVAAHGIPPRLYLQPPLAWTLSAAAFSGFAVAATLLSLVAPFGSKARTLARHLAPLPVSLADRFLVAVLGPTVMTALAGAFLMPSVIAFARAAGQPVTPSVACVLMGCLSGLSYALWPGPAALKSASLIAVIGLGTRGFSYALVHPSEAQADAIPWLAAAMLAFVLMTGAWARFAFPIQPEHGRSGCHSPRSLPRPLLPYFWYALKQARDGSSRADAIFCALLLTAAGLSLGEHPPPGWEAGWLQLGAAAAGALSATARSLSRRIRAPECSGLAGPAYFARSLILGPLLLSTLCAVPTLGFLLVRSHWPPTMSLAAYLAAVATASAVGIAIGSAIAARKEDIGFQLIVVLLAGTIPHWLIGQAWPAWVASVAISYLTINYAEHARFRPWNHHGAAAPA